MRVPFSRLSTGRTDDEVEGEEDDEGDSVVDIDGVKLKMGSYVDAFEAEIARIRGGEPRADMLDHIKVEAYGSFQPLAEIAQTALQGMTLVVRPFDPSTVADIEKAITKAELGLNPSSDGKVLRAKVPKASAEVRDRSIKQLSEAAEMTKKNIRQVRHQAVAAARAMKSVPADDIFRLEGQIQEATKAASDRVTEIHAAKKAAIVG